MGILATRESDDIKQVESDDSNNLSIISNSDAKISVDSNNSVVISQSGSTKSFASDKQGPKPSTSSAIQRHHITDLENHPVTQNILAPDHPENTSPYTALLHDYFLDQERRLHKKEAMNQRKPSACSTKEMKKLQALEYIHKKRSCTAYRQQEALKDSQARKKKRLNPLVK